uniref:hypothetical protein n=1 Tax=Candidatus Electronema sp. TaxID=2698783 RepID=UPI0040564C77
MVRVIRAVALLAVLPLLGGCGIKERAESVWEGIPSTLEEVPFLNQENRPTGAVYPPTVKAEPIFQADQAPADCKVFAHVLIWIPAEANGRGIANVTAKEAMRWGANMVLVGRSRKAVKDMGLDFAYYGPEQPYSSRDNWRGWRFGYEDWVNQGGWVTLGYDEWGKSEAWFSEPLVIQAAFLRCQG